MPNPENPGEEKLVGDVTAHGWHVVKVAEDDQGPGFTYTVGLWQSFRHPEVILVGLPGETAHVILNDLGEAVRRGEHFEAGTESEVFLEGYPVTFRPVPEDRQWPYFGFARWFYDGGAFPALQLVFPDREHRWPWQDGVAAGFRAQQPVIADEEIPGWATGSAG